MIHACMRGDQLQIQNNTHESAVIEYTLYIITYRRAGNFREVIFSLYSRIVRIRETLTAKISTDAH